MTDKRSPQQIVNDMLQAAESVDDLAKEHSGRCQALAKRMTEKPKTLTNTYELLCTMQSQATVTAIITMGCVGAINDLRNDSLLVTTMLKDLVERIEALERKVNN